MRAICLRCQRLVEIGELHYCHTDDDAAAYSKLVFPSTKIFPGKNAGDSDLLVIMPEGWQENDIALL